MRRRLPRAVDVVITLVALAWIAWIALWLLGLH
jgi:hypothetical protein